ncbi:hypothetical protein LS996_27910 (plasmid) [Bacillus cereus]
MSEKKGVNHPICKESETLVVLTTNFFLTIRNGNERKGAERKSMEF